MFFLVLVLIFFLVMMQENQTATLTSQYSSTNAIPRKHDALHSVGLSLVSEILKKKIILLVS